MLAAVLAVGLVLGLLRRVSRRISPLAVFAAAFALGAYAAALESGGQADSIAHILDAVPAGERVVVSLRGVVTDEAPLSSDAWWSSRRFLLEVERLNCAAGDRRASGKLYLYTPQPVEWGSAVDVQALISRPEPPRNPGQFDYAAYLERIGVSGIAAAPSEDLIKVTARSRGLGLGRAVAALRRRFAERIERLGLNEGGIIPAVLLGDRSGLSPGLKERFARSGTMHLLAISGLHLGVVVGFVWWLLRFARVPAGAASAIAILTAVLYALIAGARPPVVRAALMTVLFALAVVLYRKAAPLAVVSTVAAAMLLWRPLDIFDAGFQMSFSAVLGLFYIGRPTANWLAGLAGERASFVRRVLRAALAGLGWSLGAWLAVAPLAVWYFHIVTPVAPLSNLVLVPVAAAMVIAGFLAVAVSFLSWQLASLFALSASGAEMTLERAVGVLARVPAAYLYVGTINRWWLLGAMGVIVLCGALAAAHRRTLPVVIAALLVANGALYGELAFGGGREPMLQMLAEGDSEAVVFIDADGTSLVFVGRSADEAFARHIICPFLLAAGCSKVDLLVETAGADARLRDVIGMRFPVGAVLRQRRFRASESTPSAEGLFGPGDTAVLPGGAALRFHSARAQDYALPGAPWHEGLMCEVETRGRRAVIALDVTAGCLASARGHVGARPDVLAVAGFHPGGGVLDAWREEIAPQAFLDAAAGGAAVAF